MTQSWLELMQEYVDECLGEPQCMSCKHSGPGRTCAAFPKEIPWDILTGEFDHTQPYEGDNGIQYEAAK